MKIKRNVIRIETPQGQQGFLGPDHIALYAAKPTHEEIITHGPFIADHPEEIAALYQAYLKGKMMHISGVPADDQIIL